VEERKLDLEGMLVGVGRLVLLKEGARLLQTPAEFGVHGDLPPGHPPASACEDRRLLPVAGVVRAKDDDLPGDPDRGEDLARDRPRIDVSGVGGYHGDRRELLLHVPGKRVYGPGKAGRGARVELACDGGRSAHGLMIHRFPGIGD